MNIIIKTKNLELNESLENFIKNKIGKLKKFLHNNTQEIFVEVEKGTKHHRKGEVFFAEVIISLPGKKLIAQAKKEDLGKAITEVREELEREIRKYKTKIIELPRRKAKKLNQEIF